LVGVVEAVLGLDNRPQARSQHRLFRPAAATLTAFNPNQVADLYGIPASDGAGQTIAVIELGGGYVASDLATYFKGLGLTAPKVSAVLVDGAKNQPSGSANGPDGEVMLDIEVAGAVAPAASIVVYFAPNTDAGFLDALTSAVHDTVHKPTVISISWGGPESSWTAQAMTAFDQAMASAAMLGVTVCVASGDNGSGDGVGDGADHVDFPASSPHALACGGTRLTASGSAIASESVWNDGASGGAGGGGMSTQFAVPVWQKGLTAVTSSGARQPLGGRGVPDVAADADPATGYKVRVDGSDLVIGGTSAAAPLWAAIVARLQALAGKPIGPVQPSLYADPAACNDITSGDNGDFAATAGWDACTGLGSPHGAGLKKAFGL
jgi:kumamolisin